MNISAPFIKRPIATSLLTVAVLLAGAVAFPKLPMASIPEVDYPTLQVSAQLPGASPDTMASAVATPLERMFGRIADIVQMTSVSQLGSTSIILQFGLDRDIDGAARDVQAAINAARGQLPTNLPTNPNWRKVNPAELAPLVLALTSDTATAPELYDVADSILAQKISQIEGMGTDQRGRRRSPGGSGGGKSVPAEQARYRLRSGGRGAECGQCSFAQGTDLHGQSQFSAQRQRSALPCQRICAPDCGL